MDNESTSSYPQNGHPHNQDTASSLSPSPPPAPLTPLDYYARIRAIPIESIATSPDLLGSRITGRTGDEILVDCPHHLSNSKKSLHVNVAKNVWHCYGCQIGGDALQLVEFVQTGTVSHTPKDGACAASHRTARNWIADHFGLPRLEKSGITPEQRAYAERSYQTEQLLFGDLLKASQYFHRILTCSEPGRAALTILQDHYGFSREFIDSQLMGYSYPKEWTDLTTGEQFPQIQTWFRDNLNPSTGSRTGLFTISESNVANFWLPFHLTFPYWHHGRVRYLIGRTTPWTPKTDAKLAKYKKLLTHSDKHPYVHELIQNDLLFNEECLDSNDPVSLSKPVIITEGVTDLLSAVQAGFLCISPIATIAPKAERPRIISKLRGRTVFLCLDRELSSVGTIATEKWAALLEPQGIRVKLVVLPLDAHQKNAIRQLNEQFGLDADPDASGIPILPERLTMFKEQVATNNPESLERFDQLIQDAKQDLNSYLRHHSSRDLQTLLDSAPTRLERILRERTLRIESGDTKLLTDIPFVSALAQAEQTQPDLFVETIQALPSTLRTQLKKELKKSRASRRKHLQVVGSEDYTSDAPDVHPLLSVALKPLEIDLPDNVKRLSNENGHHLYLPVPYLFTKTGLVRLHSSSDGQEQQPVAPTQLFVGSRDVDIATGETYLTTHYYHRRKWRSVVVPRDVATNARKCVDLAKNDGFPVGSHNCHEVARYLFDFEHVNQEGLPKRRVSSQLGMLRKDQNKDSVPIFLWGQSNITKDGIASSQGSLNSPSLHSTPVIAFRGENVGNDQLAAGYHSRGDFSTWLSTISPIWRAYARLRLAIYASLTPPLLSILELPNFGVDFANRTSTGKTTILRAAASVWGCPDETATKTILHTWDATPIFLEQTCATANDLPLFLDDTKRANKKMIDRILYTVISGHGRGRGATRGTRATVNWRTVLLSTGESPLIDYTTSGGVRARILTGTGLPFGRDDRTTKPIVDKLNSILRRHYGHLGPMFVQHLLSNHAQWDAYRQRYNKLSDHYSARTETGAAGRLADMVALIDLTGEILENMMGSESHKDSSESQTDTVSSLPFLSPWDDLWDSVESHFESIDIHVRALRDIHSWAGSNESTFFGRHHPYEPRSSYSGEPIDHVDVAPSQGWSGKWNLGDDWTYIAFNKVRLQQVLKTLEYDGFEGIMNAWKEAGWLDCQNSQSSYTKVMRFAGHSERMVVVKRRAFEEAEGDGEGSGENNGENNGDENVSPTTVTTDTTVTTVDITPPNDDTNDSNKSADHYQPTIDLSVF